MFVEVGEMSKYSTYEPLKSAESSFASHYNIPGAGAVSDYDLLSSSNSAAQPSDSEGGAEMVQKHKVFWKLFDKKFFSEKKLNLNFIELIFKMFSTLHDDVILKT